MFGYIFPEKPELKIKEYELFRAYYCGVCKSIGRTCGQLPRFSLTYDAAFLAVLLTSIAGEKPTVKRERCIAHPVKKRYVVKESPIMQYASDMNILLAYYNLEDKCRDERSAPAMAARAALRPAFGKIKRKYKEKCDIIESRLAELDRLEKDRCASMDQAAEPFAKLMEAILEYEPLCREEKYREILRWMGYNLGKWIYILDAYDDVEENIRTKTYNPLLYQFGYVEGEDPETFRKRIREKVEFNLTYCLSQTARAYELLDPGRNSGILENIIYMGMLRKTENILGTGSCRKVEESV